MTKLIKKYKQPDETIRRRYAWGKMPLNTQRIYTDKLTGKEALVGDYVIVDPESGIILTNSNNPNLFPDLTAAGLYPGRFELDLPEVNTTAEANPSKPILLEATKTPLRRKPGLMEDNPEWQEWRLDQINQNRLIAQERDNLRKNNAMVDHLFFTLPFSAPLLGIAGTELIGAGPAVAQWLASPAGQAFGRSILYGEGLNQISKLAGYEDWGEVPYRLFGGKDYANLNQWAKLGLNFTNPGYFFNPASKVVDPMTSLTEQAMKSVPTNVTVRDLAKEMNRQVQNIKPNSKIFTETINGVPVESTGQLILQPRTVTTTYIKPWRASWSDPAKTKFNTATSVELEGRPNLYFEAVVDLEPRNISVHFKTDGQGSQGSLTAADKQALFTGLDEVIPEGSRVSTYGQVSPGGVHGLNRLAQENGYKLIGTRMVSDKEGNPLEIPIFEKVRQNGITHYITRPSTLTDIEKLGIPKVDRNQLTQLLSEAYLDLYQYIHSGRHRKIPVQFNKDGSIGWASKRTVESGEAVPLIRALTNKGYTTRGDWFKVKYEGDTSDGVVRFNPFTNHLLYSSLKFPTVEGLKFNPGEANMFWDGENAYSLRLTSPRTDMQQYITDLLYSDDLKERELGEYLNKTLATTLPKETMLDFWTNVSQVQRPGSYLSGDFRNTPLGDKFINWYKKTRLIKSMPKTVRPIPNKDAIGLSPDSYSSIIRQAHRPNSPYELRWMPGFVNWNNSAVKNKYIFDSFNKWKFGEITLDEYKQIFDKWSESIGGVPLEIGTSREGIKYPMHPHPFLYKRKRGGKLIPKK